MRTPLRLLILSLAGYVLFSRYGRESATSSVETVELEFNSERITLDLQRRGEVYEAFRVSPEVLCAVHPLNLLSRIPTLPTSATLSARTTTNP